MLENGNETSSTKFIAVSDLKDLMEASVYKIKALYK